MTTPEIMLPDMCELHQGLFVRQAGLTEDGPWRVGIVVAQIALFQAATADPKVWRECGGDGRRIQELGCLACRKPDAFGAILEAWTNGGGVDGGGLAAVKAWGERVVLEAGGKRRDG